jgi:hypothetical protein
VRVGYTKLVCLRRGFIPQDIKGDSRGRSCALNGGEVSLAVFEQLFGLSADRCGVATITVDLKARYWGMLLLKLNKELMA